MATWRNERLWHIAEASFEAARHLPTLPAEHRARRRHGHHFITRVLAEIPSGWARCPGGEASELAEALASCVAALDYCELNTHLPVPSDAHLAHWVQDHLPVPGLKAVGIQSTPEQGVERHAGGHGEEWCRFSFEAAHWLPQVGPHHPCGRRHGHHFEVILHVGEALASNEQALACDQLAQHWQPVRDALDYACLNDIPGLENPTSERLAEWLWRRLKPLIPTLSRISVHETTTAGCHFDGEQFRIWKALRFEAGLQLRQAARDDPRRRWHGHSYQLRLHLTAPLDAILGWTIDYGDVKALFRPIYQQLDHHPLNDLPALADPSPAHLVRWIRDQAAPHLASLDRIDLFETTGTGAVLCWGEASPALFV